ncbi:MAG: oligosaccharide flippase family protein [Chloroflexi bacterium]|nr:oligosaccharide flippase family protein [Chloroflexota bacterium]
MSFARQSLGSLVALGFGVLVSIVLPRVLGAEARGEYQLAVKLAGLVLAVAQWGIPEVLLQLFGEQRANVGTLIGSALVLGTAGAAAVALVLGLAAPLFQDNLLRGVEPLLLALTLGGSLASLLALLARRFIQLEGRVDLYNAMDVGRTLLFLVLVLIGGVLLPRQALGPTIAWLLGEVALCAVAVFFLRRMRPVDSTHLDRGVGPEHEAPDAGPPAMHFEPDRSAGQVPLDARQPAMHFEADRSSGQVPLDAAQPAMHFDRHVAPGNAAPNAGRPAMHFAPDRGAGQVPLDAAQPGWRVDTGVMREFARAGAPIQFGLLGMFVGSEGGAFVLNASLDVGSVGIYSVALSIARLVLQISIALRTALQPRLVGPERDSAAVTARVTRHGLLWMVLVAIGLAVGSPLVPLVFTREFAGAAPALLLMLPGMIAYGVWQLLASHLLRIGRRGFLAATAWLFGVVSIVLQAIGSQTLGLVGAAAGLSLAYILATAVVLIVFVRSSGRSARELVPAPGDLAFYVGLTRRALAAH